MTPDEHARGNDREPRLTPEQVRGVRFPRAGMLHHGYEEADVDRFTARVADELARLAAERAALDDAVHTLRAQLGSLEEQLRATAPHEPPSEQAVRILAVAQQTADQYVAEAEDFSRQLTSDARAQYEEQLHRAREDAGAILQAAHETATRMVAEGGAPQPDGDRPTPEELQEQVRYLQAFGQAVRVQLRAYLEALITDVESEWGRADPATLPQAPRRPADAGSAGAAPLNTVADVPQEDGGVEVSGLRR